MNKSNAQHIFPIRLVLTIIAASLGIILALTQPFSGLDGTGHIMLGTIIAALSVWIFRPAGGTFFIGAIIIFLGGTFAGLSMTELANGFASSSLWLLIPAMFLGSALLSTGLGRRMVYMLFTKLNLTYAKILAGWFVVGIIFALLTPSITVRFLILTPIAVSVADACRLEKHSRGRSLIVISAWSVSVFPAIAWLTGSLYGPVFTSYLPAGKMSEMATGSEWLRVMALPWILFSVVFLAVLYLALKPEKPLSVTKEQLRHMYNELGAVSAKERGCMAAFLLLLVCLPLQIFLPITTGQIMLASLILLLVSGVFGVKDISLGISWDTIAFFGVILSFSLIFQVSGITDWLSPILASFLKPIAATPLLFTLALFAICVVIRFVDVAQGWISSAILAMATPMLYDNYGIHPLICIMVFITASNLFIFRYHQPWIGQVEAVCGENGWNPRHLLKASIIYLILAFLFLALSCLYWKMTGVI